jgi:hypothetical protein
MPRHAACARESCTKVNDGAFRTPRHGGFRSYSAAAIIVPRGYGQDKLCRLGVVPRNTAVHSFNSSCVFLLVIRECPVKAAYQPDHPRLITGPVLPVFAFKSSAVRFRLLQYRRRKTVQREKYFFSSPGTVSSLCLGASRQSCALAYNKCPEPGLTSSSVLAASSSSGSHSTV